MRLAVLRKHDHTPRWRGTGTSALARTAQPVDDGHVHSEHDVQACEEDRRIASPKREFALPLEQQRTSHREQYTRRLSALGRRELVLEEGAVADEQAVRAWLVCPCNWEM